MNRRSVRRGFAPIVDERPSFELPPEEIEALRAKFQAARFNPLEPLPEQEALRQTAENEEYCTWKAQHPCILEQFAKFCAIASGKRVVVFLDYDGTLTPIVSNPDRAFMSDQMREAVHQVAGLFPTAIISGRGRDKLESFVRLNELFYAGSHGMDIVGPQVFKNGSSNGHAFQPAAEYGPIMDELYTTLQKRIEHISGAGVEHNKFCISVHFRNCQPEHYEDIVHVVEDTLSEHDNLKATRGRKVLEIRPKVDWDKGKALLHLLGTLGLSKDEDVLSLYIGDDRTDEDAFRVLRENNLGFGILVSTKVKETHAVYTLRDPADVMNFLHRLVEWGSSTSNVWHTSRACNGWHLQAK